MLRFIDVLSEHRFSCGRIGNCSVTFPYWLPRVETDTFTHVIAAGNRIITTERVTDEAFKCVSIQRDASRPVRRTVPWAGCQDSIPMLRAYFTAKSTRYIRWIEVHRDTSVKEAAGAAPFLTRCQRSPRSSS